LEHFLVAQEFEMATQHSMTTTIVIRHGIRTTPEFVLGFDPGFPVGGSLNPLAVRRAYAALMARDVWKFDDGLYHGEAHPFAMVDLLDSMSESEATASGFVSLPGKPGTKTLVHLGVRWDVSPRYKQVRIYGPKSDPDNVVVLDLTGAAE
jgi:hypothetical protein